MEELTHICKCNNCETIMFDENPTGEPNVSMKKYRHASAMVQLKDTEGLENIVEGIVDDSYFWACPVCLTDSYLTDLVD